MAYTPPAYNAVSFAFNSFSVPAYNAVDFDFQAWDQAANMPTDLVVTVILV